ncbi:hypothetical protein OUZ56_009990 [Daphnia magna]|uniref:Secreted protein n=1 Tax=Daphnia magna TaxID=35525 RepID=A0ABR0AHH1_9CRUS|nr:hypothetical protein OUZ56_009990 [Daphnia magna]
MKTFLILSFLATSRRILVAKSGSTATKPYGQSRRSERTIPSMTLVRVLERVKMGRILESSVLATMAGKI